MSSHIVVIGSGVIGLSAAVELQEAGYQVTIIARDLPAPWMTIDPKTQINYTTPWGGAHNRWVPPAGKDQDHRDHQLSLQTFHRMKELADANPTAGITFMKGIEYLEAPTSEYVALTEDKARELGMEGFRRLRPDEFPDSKVKWGCEYDTWCVNPMVYCSFLLQRFIFRGGKAIKREIRSLLEVFGMKDLGFPGQTKLVVNCSGNGFGDINMFITRGQTCLVANLCDVTVTRQCADGSWTFCVPRNFEGGTIIGGTKEVDNWDPEPSFEVRERLCRAFVATYPQIAGESGTVTVLEDIVGRRPTRHGGARLEREPIGDGKTLVHAYGLGGRGFELSWGVAQTVLRLVEEAASTKARL